jgi:hypothetical protein
MTVAHLPYEGASQAASALSCSRCRTGASVVSSEYVLPEVVSYAESALSRARCEKGRAT